MCLCGFPKGSIALLREKEEPRCLFYTYKPLCDIQYSICQQFNLYLFLISPFQKEICDRQRVGAVCTRLATLAKFLNQDGTVYKEKTITSIRGICCCIKTVKKRKLSKGTTKLCAFHIRASLYKLSNIYFIHAYAREVFNTFF